MKHLMRTQLMSLENIKQRRIREKKYMFQLHPEQILEQLSSFQNMIPLLRIPIR